MQIDRELLILSFVIMNYAKKGIQGLWQTFHCNVGLCTRMCFRKTRSEFLYFYWHFNRHYVHGHWWYWQLFLTDRSLKSIHQAHTTACEEQTKIHHRLYNNNSDYARNTKSYITTIEPNRQKIFNGRAKLGYLTLLISSCFCQYPYPIRCTHVCATFGSCVHCLH